MTHKGAEEARNQLPHLLEAAEDGQSTVITRHGRPIAALVPIGDYIAAIRQEPLTRWPGPVARSGAEIVLGPLANCATNGAASV